MTFSRKGCVGELLTDLREGRADVEEIKQQKVGEEKKKKSIKTGGREIFTEEKNLPIRGNHWKREAPRKGFNGKGRES